MDISQTPWIELIDVRGQNGAYMPPDEGMIQALVAFMIHPRSYEERFTMKWGWNIGAALDEYLERMQQFIETIHYRKYRMVASSNLSRRSIALRIISDPENRVLSFCLLASVVGENNQDAQTKALDFFYELLSTFPYDYILTPISNQEDFDQYTGRDLIQGTGSYRSLIEIGRFESSLVSQQTTQYQLGEWQWSKHSNELIWRAMATSPVPVLLSIMFQPTLLHDLELKKIAELAESAQQIASQSSSPTIQKEARWAAGIYKVRLENMRFPYLLQVHLISPKGVPPFVERVVGNSLTLSPSDFGDPQPGYCASLPNQSQDLCKDSLLLLDPILGVSGGSSIYNRLRLLSCPKEVCSVMRLPYTNEFGIPGVNLLPQREDLHQEMTLNKTE